MHFVRRPFVVPCPGSRPLTGYDATACDCPATADHDESETR